MGVTVSPRHALVAYVYGASGVTGCVEPGRPRSAANGMIVSACAKRKVAAVEDPARRASIESRKSSRSGVAIR
ncbi:hypothetical protein CMMCAS03_07510 [Clavibacter michiganensis subsp. michiganensis]|nr:hypothetical protein CMMCAS03_07510 [Clavibacter michiganensis subsp. michiganensis]OUD92972.1 hypothetical protein CMMCAS04_08315 [Clavibacter michiganensis subsp. michiganensis]